jgi:pantoate--beta-alanine ligase
VRVEVQPTIREPDGLAMSSRNAYLGEDDRRRAPALHRALESARRAARPGASADDVLGPARRVLADAGIEPEYLEIRDADRLEPIGVLNGRPALIAVAAQFGDTRLIDNVTIESTPDPSSAGGEQRS